MRPSWTNPICDACWDRHYSERVPHRIIAAVREMCAWCGMPNSSGIYVRADPKDLPYPRMEEP